MLLPNITDSGGVPLLVNFDSPEDFLLFGFQLVFATTVVLVAGSVVVAILATRALRLQNRLIFMLNTSIVDTLVGVSVYYLGLFDVSERHPPRNGTGNMLPSLLGVNVMTFLFAQFDRYFAVCHPFFYTRYITRRVVISANVFCWLYVYSQTIVVSLLPLSKAFEVYMYGIVWLQVFALTKVVMTVKLFVVARFQLDKEAPGVDKESKKESLRIIMFVVITFLVLWLPAFIYIFVTFAFGRYMTDFRNDAHNPFKIIVRFTSVSTPSVYIWGSPSLREALVRTVWGRVCPRCGRRVGSCHGKGVEKALK